MGLVTGAGAGVGGDWGLPPGLCPSLTPIFLHRARNYEGAYREWLQKEG